MTVYLKWDLQIIVYDHKVTCMHLYFLENPTFYIGSVIVKVKIFLKTSSELTSMRAMNNANIAQSLFHTTLLPLRHACRYVFVGLMGYQWLLA